ncbi:DNA polymerase family A, partial [Candidatus Electrothrix marina]
WVQQFMDDIMDQARVDGYVTTLLGRRRQLPEINVSNANRRQFAERMAINTPIQGTASDIIKLAMIKVHEELIAQKAQAKLLLQIHDELVLEVPEDELESISVMVKEAMESVMALDVPLKVNTEVGGSLDKGE